MLEFHGSSLFSQERWCLFDPRWQVIRVTLVGGWNWQSSEMIDDQLHVCYNWQETVFHTYGNFNPEQGSNIDAVTANKALSTVSEQIKSLLKSVLYSWGAHTGKNSEAVQASEGYRKITEYLESIEEEQAQLKEQYEELSKKYPHITSTRYVLLSAAQQYDLFVKLDVGIKNLISRDFKKRWSRNWRHQRVKYSKQLLHTYRDIDGTPILQDEDYYEINLMAIQAQPELHAFCNNVGIILVTP